MNYRDLPPLSKAERAKIKRPATASQTLLAKMDTCHRSAALHLKYGGEDRDKSGERTMGTWQGHQLIRGAIFHEAVRRAKRVLIDSEETSMPGEMVKEIAIGVINEHPELPLPEYEQDVIRVCAYNWGEATIIDPATIIGVEEQFVWELKHGTITGKPDFMEITPQGTLRIRDYKTGLHMPSSDELRNGRRSFQGKLYSGLALFGKPEGEDFVLGEGIQQVEFSQEYPRLVNDETGELLYRSVTFERNYLQADFRPTLESHLQKLDHAFKTGKWQAVQGTHCPECPAPSDCPLPARLRDLAPIETREQAEDAANRILIREREQRRDRKGLRGYAEQHDEPIMVGDYAFDFNVQTNGDGVTSTPFRKRKQTDEERTAA